MGCHFLFQKIFPTQGSNPYLLRWQLHSLPLYHLESANILISTSSQGWRQILYSSFAASKYFYFCPAAAAAAKSCLTLCDPIDSSPPGSPVPGFSRLEHWSGLPFPSPRHACMLSHCSCVRLCLTLWTAAHQAPLSTGFSRQKYWRGLPFPSPFLP